MGNKKIKHLGKKRYRKKNLRKIIQKLTILFGLICSLITLIYVDKHIKELYKEVNIEGSAIEFYIDMAKSWIDDKDAVSDKVYAYYTYIVRQ